MSQESIMQFVTMVVVPLVILVLAYVNEVGFENLVSQLFIEKYLKPLKRYQPLLVSATGILLAYVSQLVGVKMVPDLAPYLTASGDIGTVFAGLLVAVLAMAFHQKAQNASVVG